MAFFSNQGTMIHSAAAGGPLMTFQDGSLGRRRRRVVKRRRRPVRSLYSIYNRRSMGEYFSGMAGGPLMAFQDGSLGKTDFGVLEAYHDGSLGAGPGPLMSYHDGSLGMPLFLQSGGELMQLEEPVTIHHGPLGEYFSGMAGCRSCGGLGQAAAALVLDLSNPATLLEFKQALVIAPWMSSALQTPEATDDVEKPVWTDMTINLLSLWVSGYVDFLYAQPTPPQQPKAQFMDALIADGFQGEFFVPTLSGLKHIYIGATLGAASVGMNPAEAFPQITQLLSAAEGGAAVEILPPVFGSQTSQANLMAIGVGLAAVALVGAIVLGGKKKRK